MGSGGIKNNIVMSTLKKNDTILTAMDVGREDFQRPTVNEVINREEDIFGGEGGGGGGGYNPPVRPSGENWFMPSNLDKDKIIDTTYFINKDNDEKSYDNWIKRVSIYKGTPNIETFSNNIFSSGEKVIWGTPQRYASSGIEYKNGTFCGENDNEYVGYTLDDEASYGETKDKNYYSAIGINDDVVSGDYFAKLVNGKYDSNGCFGKPPAKNSGYVFKSLPDGEIVYLTYINEINTNPRGINKDNGIYYSSFIYPVIEKPMKVFAKFFIWNEFAIEFPENGDGVAEIAYKEMAGRTELKIQNGIRFNGHLGSIDDSGYTYGVDVSNISVANLINQTNNKELANVSGMTVLTFDSLERPIEIEAYRTESGINYAVGVPDITEAHYEITEGYPYVDKDTDLSYVVNKISDSIEYDGFFGEYATYEIQPGKGLAVTLRGEGGTGSGKGWICMQPATATGNNQLLYKPTGNDGYIYFQERGGKQPIYHVLCYLDVEYLKKNNEGRDRYIKKVSSPQGELVIMRIGYYNNRMCNIRWSYKYVEEETVTDKNGNSFTDEVEYIRDECYDLRRDGGWSRGTIGDNKNRLSGIFKMLWGTAKDDSKTYHEFIKPVPNYRIKCVESWFNTIIAHANNYGKVQRMLRDDEKDSIFYYVDWLTPPLVENGMGEGGVYKIYPVLLQQNIEDDGIDLSLFGVYGEFIDMNGNYILNENDYVTGKKINFTVNYEIAYTAENSDLDRLTASNLNQAKERLIIKYNGNSKELVKGPHIGEYWKIETSTPELVSQAVFESTDNKSVCYVSKTVNDNGAEVDDTYYIKYYVTLTLDSQIPKNKFDDSILFYITNENQGEMFTININEYEPLLNVYEDSNLNIIKSEYNFINNSDSITIYVGCKNINNENLIISYTEDDVNKAFAIQELNSFSIDKDGIKYVGKSYKISVEANLTSGNYSGSASFKITGKETDTRYISTFNYTFNYSITGITVSPTTIRTYTTGPCSGQSITIRPENIDTNISQIELGDILKIKSDDFGAINFTPIKNNDKVYFEYDGDGLVPDAGKEYNYEVILSEGSKEYKAEFNLVAYPYVQVNLKTINEDGFPEMHVGGKRVTTGGTIFTPQVFNNDFSSFNFTVIFIGQLLRRLYYFAPSKFSNSISEKAIFIDALINTGNTFTKYVPSKDYYNVLDSNYIKNPSTLQLHRVELGDLYKIKIGRGPLNINEVNKEGLTNGREIKVRLSNETSIQGGTTLTGAGVTEYTIDYSKFTKKDEIKLCVSVAGLDKNEYLSVMYDNGNGNVEFTRIPHNIKPTFFEFPYEISILEIGPTPTGREMDNGKEYVYSEIKLAIKINEED
jgi:hypothetical protein